jgi:uncharacterized protein (DUF1697 family)
MMASPLYQSMTIRSWTTTMKLLELIGGAAPPDRATRGG